MNPLHDTRYRKLTKAVFAFLDDTVNSHVVSRAYRQVQPMQHTDGSACLSSTVYANRQQIRVTCFAFFDNFIGDDLCKLFILLNEYYRHGRESKAYFTTSSQTIFEEHQIFQNVGAKWIHLDPYDENAAQTLRDANDADQVFTALSE